MFLKLSHEIAKEKLLLSKGKTKENYDKSVYILELHVGDLVLLQDKARKGKWLGPYPVVEINSNENVSI